jgi:hypothetical protein
MASKSPDLEVRDLERFHRAHQESVVARAYRAALLDTSLNLPPCTVLYRFLARTGLFETGPLHHHPCPR